MSDHTTVIAHEGQMAVVEIFEGEGDGPADTEWSPDHEPHTVIEWRVLASDMGRGKRPGQYDPDSEISEAYRALSEGRFHEARQYLATAIAELESFTPMTVRVSVMRAEL